MMNAAGQRILGGFGIGVAMLAAACAGVPPAPAAPAQSWPLACGAFPPAGAPVEECARRSADGEIVLRPGVLPGGGDPSGVHTVVVDGELLFALASGRTAPAQLYDNGADYFVEGLARSPRDGRVGFVDEQLDLVVPREWDFAFPFEGGVARVCSGCEIRRAEGDEHSVVSGGRWGYIDRKGRVVVPVVHAADDLPAPPSR